MAAEPYIAEDEVAAAGHEVLVDTADEGQLPQVGLDLPQLVLEEITLVVELGLRHQRRQQRTNSMRLAENSRWPKNWMFRLFDLPCVLS